MKTRFLKSPLIMKELKECKHAPTVIIIHQFTKISKINDPKRSRNMQFLLLSIVFAFANSFFIEVSARDKPQVDIKRYSYICLAARQDLCIGISPGEGEPFYDPANIFGIQVKSRLNNEYTGNDYKKTRWDVDYYANTVALSKFQDLCIAKAAGSNAIILSPCAPLQDARPQDTYGLWDLKFQDNENWEGTLELIGYPRRLCATLVECLAMGKEYCDPNSDAISLDKNTFKKGSYIRIKPCWDDPANGGLEIWKDAQIWRQRLDCAVGCPPFYQLNGVCDPICDVPECNYDNGDCRTGSPTPPTKSPTKPPSTSPTPYPVQGPTSSPTAEPTIPHLTLSPTTLFPTDSPSKSPTRKNTKSPTNHPTFPCPPQDLFNFCARFTRNSCIRKPVAKMNCVYCFDKCSPRADERACQVEGFYDHCKPDCPTYDQVQRCPLLDSVQKCRRTPFGRRNCSWCGDKCVPGKNRGACTSGSFYEHCNSVKVPCPTIQQFSQCEKYGTNEKQCKSQYGKKNCSWCPSLGKCMAGTRDDVCTVPDFYDHCPRTPNPTNAPTITRSPTREAIIYEEYGNNTEIIPPTPAPTLPTCPSAAVVKGCKAFLTNPKGCTDSAYGRKNCTWCPLLGCKPGKLAEVCTNPVFYNHCNLVG